MKYRTLFPFVAYGMTSMPDRIIEIENKLQALDLIKLGWIEKLQEQYSNN